MRNISAMLAMFGVVAIGCSSYPSRKPVVVTNPEHPVVAKKTLDQLTPTTAKVVGETEPTILSIRQGLPYVQKISQNPVLAVTEQDDWFFYATTIAYDKNNYQPVAFISGYAIKRSGRQILEWSLW